MERVYIRLRHRIQIKEKKDIYLGDIAKLVGDSRTIQGLQKLYLYRVKESDRNLIIFDFIQVADKVHRTFPGLELLGVGPDESIVEILPPPKKINPLLFLLIWLLLFIGSGISIMNFHEDVSMRAVQMKLYTIITGEVQAKPLIFQIPYSIGLGLGMVLFFNHFFKKKFNEEPSPLEVEMFNYQQELDRYSLMNENEESMITIDDIKDD